MWSNHLILCHPLLLSSLIFPIIRVFSNESALCIRRPKDWSSASASVLPMNIQGWFPLELIGLISLLSRTVSKLFKSLLQHYNLKGSILRLSAKELWSNSHPYVTTEKVIALIVWSFVSKMMSLFFNVLSRLVIAFLPRSKHIFFSWLQQPSTVILETSPKIKSVNVPTFSPSLYHEVMRPDVMILIFWMLNFKSAISLSSFILIEILFKQVLFHVIYLYILFLNLIRETL